ncbi:hypothetical protein [Salinispora arenicola]|uniref:hypothetical protein n=1 Tax=Salinispora arenicola TaxID=168697 RepID=UPI002079DC1B|nr:hypothetical protein [Salinispora arenicola]MCN0152508.1 hypothetical protein [Salinispora arenicola]
MVMVNLSLDPPSKTSAPRALDLDPEDYPSLVMEACESLAEAGCRFRIGGFWQDDWGLDVGYDLSAVIEQLPDLLAALRAGEKAELDMYAQGVERSLFFDPRGNVVVIRCFSRTSWMPIPGEVEQERFEVVAMLENLAQAFGKAIAIADPTIGKLRPFDRWRKGIV